MIELCVYEGNRDKLIPEGYYRPATPEEILQAYREMEDEHRGCVLFNNGKSVTIESLVNEWIDEHPQDALERIKVKHRIVMNS